MTRWAIDTTSAVRRMIQKFAVDENATSLNLRPLLCEYKALLLEIQISKSGDHQDRHHLNQV